MPYYDYRCQTCQRKLTLFYKTYTDYDQAIHTCPYCNSTALTRLINRVIIGKSEGSRVDNLTEADVLANIDESDPRSIGRFMRKMGREMGEDLGDEFNEVIDRLEKGQSPDDIEKVMPNLADESSPTVASDTAE